MRGGLCCLLLVLCAGVGHADDAEKSMKYYSWWDARQTHTKALVYQGLAPSSQGSSLQHADALRCCACHLAA